jgi:hypothetical protein
MVYRPIQIKYSIASNNVPTLIPGELAFTQAGNNFFIGSPDGSAGNIRIGHKLNDGTLTANQALVANSTGGINRIYTSEIDTTNLTVQVIRTDQIYTRNINVSTLTANGSTGNSGYVLVASSNGVYWASATSILGDIQISNTGTITSNNISAIGDVLSNNVISNNVIVSGNINSNYVISNTVNSNTVIASNVNSNNVISNTVITGNVNSNYVNSNNVISSNIVAGNIRTNSITVNNFVFASVASTANQQIYVSNGSAGYWSSRYFVGGFEIVPEYPNYGDVWYSTIDDKPFMWVNNGYFDTWYDFLPPTF